MELNEEVVREAMMYRWIAGFVVKVQRVVRGYLGRRAFHFKRLIKAKGPIVLRAFLVFHAKEKVSQGL